MEKALFGTSNLSMAERRRQPRYECAYAVNYTTDQLASIEGNTWACNVSKGGMRVRVSRLVRRGDAIAMCLHINSQENPIFAVGEVRWTRRCAEEPKFTVDAGIRFTYIEPFDQDRLILNAGDRLYV